MESTLYNAKRPLLMASLSVVIRKKYALLEAIVSEVQLLFIAAAAPTRLGHQVNALLCAQKV